MDQTNRVWLTTGQAAKLCSVTPATVLNWIRQGRLEGVRTAGGHYRIQREGLEPLLSQQPATRGESSSHRNLPPRGLRCWEYLSSGKSVAEDCKECVVYRVRAGRCFELASIDTPPGQARRFCQTSCDDCGYFRRAMGLPTNVLVVTSDPDLVAHLSNPEPDTIALRFAGNPYEASAVVQRFLPDFAVVDQDRNTGGGEGLLECLAYDPRLPGLKIIVALTNGTPRAPWHGRDKPFVVRVIEKPFDTQQIVDVIDEFPVEAAEPEERNSLTQRVREERAMMYDDGHTAVTSRDENGFLKTMASWDRSTAEALALEHDIGPLTEDHWKVIEFVQWYYNTYGSGPPVVRVHKETGLRSSDICRLFPCGMVKGAYRLAGLPRPPGCA